ncbi:MAG: phosphotransferase [Clostridiales bacterium]|nr:phosphotransferase [Clostridiales bacterium]
MFQLKITVRHIAKWALPKAAVGAGLSREYIAEFKELCARLARQLIHRGTHPENILWHGGEISGFIDFDIAQRNVRLWAVCYCSTALLADCPINERGKWFDVLQGPLRGYGSVLPLTDDEKRAVYCVVCSVQIVFIARGEPESEMTRMNREMLELVAENKERIRSVV